MFLGEVRAESSVLVKLCGVRKVLIVSAALHRGVRPDPAEIQAYRQALLNNSLPQGPWLYYDPVFSVRIPF